MPELKQYHVWSIASVRFSLTPDALSEEQQERLAHDVDRALKLEAAILATPEATNVSIPMDQQAQAAAEWQAAHPECDLSEDAISNGIRRELLVQAILDGVAARAAVPTEADVKAFYMADPKQFNLPERREVRHILVTINPEYPENTETEAKLRVDRIVASLQGGEEFSDLAGKYSECPTAMQGGLVGTVPKGTLYPEVEGEAFGLSAGEWGGPVRTELGWHLVKCDAVLPAEETSFEAAAEKILSHLLQQNRRAAQVEWLKALSKQSAA